MSAIEILAQAVIDFDSALYAEDMDFRWVDSARLLVAQEFSESHETVGRWSVFKNCKLGHKTWLALRDDHKVQADSRTALEIKIQKADEFYE